jgi:hypothetical protein
MNGTAHIGTVERTPRDTFVLLLTRGFWPVVIYPPGVELPDDRISTGKEPMWPKWGLERWTPEKGNRAFGQFKEAGVGVCLGPGRGPKGSWLADVEGDGPEADESRVKLFGGE